MALRLTLALLMLVVTAAIAGRRIFWLFKLIRSGQPDKTRTRNPQERAVSEGEEVLGQKKLLKWAGPGLAHFFTFWGFNVLGITIIECYGALVIEQGLRLPVLRPRPLARVPRGLLRRRRAARDHLVRDQPAGRARPSAASGNRASTARTPARPGSSSA